MLVMAKRVLARRIVLGVGVLAAGVAAAGPAQAYWPYYGYGYGYRPYWPRPVYVAPAPYYPPYYAPYYRPPVVYAPPPAYVPPPSYRPLNAIPARPRARPVRVPPRVVPAPVSPFAGPGREEGVSAVAVPQGAAMPSVTILPTPPPTRIAPVAPAAPAAPSVSGGGAPAAIVPFEGPFRGD